MIFCTAKIAFQFIILFANSIYILEASFESLRANEPYAQKSAIVVNAVNGCGAGLQLSEHYSQEDGIDDCSCNTDEQSLHTINDGFFAVLAQTNGC